MTVLDELILSSNELNFVYSRALILKKTALIGAAYEALGKLNNAKDVYLDKIGGMVVVRPYLSEEYLWKTHLYERLLTLTLGMKKGNQLEMFKTMFSQLKIANEKVNVTPGMVAKHNGYLLFLNELMLKAPDNEEVKEELINSVNVLYQLAVKNSTFPKATELNNIVESFCDTVMYIWDTSNVVETDQLLHILRDSVSKSYQSSVVLRNMSFALSKMGSNEEALLSFHVYMDYVERINLQREKGNFEVKAENIFSQIRVTTEILKSVISQNNLDKTTEISKILKTLIDIYDSQYSIKHLNDSGDKSGSSVRSLLAHAWLALTDILSIDDATCEEYLRKSLMFNWTTKCAFKLALLQAKDSRLASATELLAKKILVTDPQDAQSWHLLGLILSVKEDKRESLIIIKKALSLLSNGSLKNSRFKDKYAVLQIKCTELALIEATDGLDTALQMLPELFLMFSDIFGEIKNTDLKNTKKAGKDIDQMALHWSHRPSISGIPQLTHTSVPSQNTENILKYGKSGKSKNNPRSKCKISDKQVKREQEVLQKLWIFASNLYFKAGLLEESELCIIEAEAANGLNMLTHAQLGLLTRDQRSLLSLQEFETALEEDEDNLQAILGLAYLFLEKGSIGASDSVFMTDRDRLSGQARIKCLLEKITQRSIGKDCSEAWWYLSKVHKLVGDKTGERTAIWKCISLEENRPVRAWDSVLPYN